MFQHDGSAVLSMQDRLNETPRCPAGWTDAEPSVHNRSSAPVGSVRVPAAGSARRRYGPKPTSYRSNVTYNREGARRWRMVLLRRGSFASEALVGNKLEVSAISRRAGFCSRRGAVWRVASRPVLLPVSGPILLRSAAKRRRPFFRRLKVAGLGAEGRRVAR